MPDGYSIHKIEIPAASKVLYNLNLFFLEKLQGIQPSKLSTTYTSDPEHMLHRQ